MASRRELINQLRAEYQAETDPDRRQQIEVVYDQALEASEKLAAHQIGANTVEYEAAIAELETSVEELKKARQDLADFAETINKVATAVDMLAKVAKKVAGGI
ncbi:MAG: hypothetical protein GY791_20670 [Alphaproteobacteria bacterium]|nr:hypothetical protein [Alphaproteobacteria bacterium]